jgi:hypothetical protein
MAWDMHHLVADIARLITLLPRGSGLGRAHWLLAR